MFMVRRMYIPNRVEFKRLWDLHEAAHREFAKDDNRNIVLTVLKDEAGNHIGRCGINLFETWDEVNHYVYDDPFTKAGMFASIEIHQIDMYLLDGTYDRAPAWFEPTFRELQAQRRAALAAQKAAKS
jgi:hypothetical protein